MNGEGARMDGEWWRPKRAVTKNNLNLNLQKTELQDCWNGRACNLQIDRACSLQELELQMSVLNREKKCRITD